MGNFKLKSLKAALVKAMLDGNVLDITNGMRMIGATNTPREIGRSIINPKTGFGARVIKKRVDITTQYQNPGFYYTYQLDRSESNKEAISKMRKYLSESDLKPIERIKSTNQQYCEQDLFTTLDYD